VGDVSEITPDQIRLIRLSSSLATGESEAIERDLEACTECPQVEVEEAILQSYLFLGYPAALNAFAAWRRVSRLDPLAPVVDDLEKWRAGGAYVCRIVYGGQYPRLRDNIRDLHPDMERWMVAEGYGKVLARSGLGLPMRELCISAILAVLGAQTQLYSHLRGALNVGLPAGVVTKALEIAGEYLDEAGILEMDKTWSRVLTRYQKIVSE
jgi:4-carboxymuconolactone decarboxylase